MEFNTFPIEALSKNALIDIIKAYDNRVLPETKTQTTKTETTDEQLKQENEALKKEVEELKKEIIEFKKTKKSKLMKELEEEKSKNKLLMEQINKSLKQTDDLEEYYSDSDSDDEDTSKFLIE
jgi:predicted RNase H-like nuclease (RuvC/YqgF family)